jgi:hypothetical protein
MRGEVAFFGARIRGAVAAEESGRAAKSGKQRWTADSTVPNRSALVPERKPVSGVASAYS